MFFVKRGAKCRIVSQDFHHLGAEPPLGTTGLSPVTAYWRQRLQLSTGEAPCGDCFDHIGELYSFLPRGNFGTGHISTQQFKSISSPVYRRHEQSSMIDCSTNCQWEMACIPYEIPSDSRGCVTSN